MKPNFYNRLPSFIKVLLLCLPFSAFSQVNLGNIAQSQIVNENTLKDANTRNFVNSMPTANVLSLDESKIQTLLNNPNAYQIQIPTKNDGVLTVNLSVADIFTDDFRVVTPNGTAQVELPTFYWGKVVGKKVSSVALTVTKDGIEGMLSYDNHSMTFGKIKNIKEDLHIIYESAEIPNNTPICAMPPIEVESNEQSTPSINLVPTNCKAVRIRMEADYKIFTDFNSNLTNATNYVTSLFNQVALLYYNEAVNIKLSVLFVWTTTDPHATSSTTSNVLSSLRSYWNAQSDNFGGDICHFITTRSMGGGVAYILGGTSIYGGMTSRAVFQGTSRSNAYGMSASLSTTVVNIPTYSWSVEVITHELGHNFGLPHTHSCTWPLDPNSPAVKEKIDDCGNLAGYTTEGTCTTTTTSGQGTIMSYCHLVSGRGINFNLGFGTKPGDKMRAEVAAASSLTGLVSPSVSNLLSCTAGSFTLTASGCQGPSGSVSYRWYSASTGGTLLHTGATYSTPTISTTTVYHVECTVSQGCTSARTAATVTIYSPSQALTPPTTQSVSFCANQSVTLFASGCQSGAQYKWYANSTATTALTTGQTYTTPVLSATTQYVAACESSGCLSSSRVTATATQTATVCTYCTVPNQDCTDGDQITRVRIQQNTTDLLNRTSTCATNGYELISTPVTNLTIGTAYSITVTNPGTYPEGLRVWIDYNKNGLFESTEVIQNVNSSTWTSNTASFTIPNTATTGNTRMRVKLAYESNVTDPCAGGGYGEAEDYIINIVSNCPQSMTLLSPADNITTGNVTKQASSANNGLITARNKIQNLNTRATYQAKSILLDTGFTAEQGTIFRAEIGGCN